MNRKNWIALLAALIVISAGAVVYFAIGNKTTPPQTVTASMWPDVKSFDVADKTFEAKDLNTGEKIKVLTDASTKYYKIVYEAPSPSDYFDFQSLYSLLKNWEGPTWRFTLNGTVQNDGSIMASEIFYTIQ
ncbi:MAG: hypothetical protein LiPW15_710 [Parcubacteria group bacterium LiPW_15]|nr:MAG: hypothetical protein LiPW15_710 [Parcubacteria group bacterium LiPW_15]